MRRKTIAILLAVAMVASLCMTGSAMAKSKKKVPKLVKSVVEKKYDTEMKKWVKIGSTTFTYNKKGDPTKIVKNRKTGDDYNWVYDNTFKYKKGKKVSLISKIIRTITDEDGNHITTTNITVKYNKKGLQKKSVDKVTRTQYENTSTTTFTYKKNFVNTMKYKDSDNSEVRKFVYKFKKGLPTKGTCLKKKGKKWEKVSKAIFNKMGLITKETDYTYIVSNSKYKYNYNKNGLVKNVVGTYSDGDYDKIRLEFKYTKKSIDKVRYAKMMNYLVDSWFNMDWY